MNDAAAPVICLASASPRRRELLAQIGVACHVAPADIDERERPNEAPPAYVLRMAREKAARVWADPTARRGLPVLAADTSVVLGERILGKPRDRDEGLAMLAALSDRTHQVLSAVVLVTAAGAAERLSTSEVRMRATTAAEREAYWRTGEPRDKAGGYAIQGLAAAFIADLRGSFSGVMGLPLYETTELLAAAGFSVLESHKLPA